MEIQSIVSGKRTRPLKLSQRLFFRLHANLFMNNTSFLSIFFYSSFSLYLGWKTCRMQFTLLLDHRLPITRLITNKNRKYNVHAPKDLSLILHLFFIFIFYKYNLLNILLFSNKFTLIIYLHLLWLKLRLAEILIFFI